MRREGKAFQTGQQAVAKQASGHASSGSFFAHVRSARQSGSASTGQQSLEAKRPQKRSRFSPSTFLVVAILLVGVGLLLYPTFSDWWNSRHQSQVVMSYAQSVSAMDEEQRQAMIEAAQAYNAQLAQSGELWEMTDEQRQEYESLLDVDGTGVMGYITIPKINVQLPIYHGTDDAVLQTSIGHIAGTSLPVGGESTHSVLSGHRGLPSARLFTDLDKLSEGDTFTLTILDQTLTYQVDQIRIVEPNDLSELQIEEGQDLCTLVTCTPYGINTHRLLVRGHRIPNADGSAQILADALQIRPVYVIPFIAAPVIAILIIYLLWKTRRGSTAHVSDGARNDFGNDDDNPSSADSVGRYLQKKHLSRPRDEWLDEGQSPTEALRTVLRRRRKGEGR